MSDAVSGAKTSLGAGAGNEADARAGACIWVEDTAFGWALGWDSSRS